MGNDVNEYVCDAVKNDLGYSNGWTEIPEEVKACKLAGHEHYYTTLGKCLTEYGCIICGYKFRVDSSD